jgi:general secretion pathway protein L
MQSRASTLPSIRALGAGFFTWWFAELMALASTLRPLMRARGNTLTLDTSDEQWRLRYRTGAHMVELGPVDLKTGLNSCLPKGTKLENTVLKVLVAPDKALRKSLDMPSVAEPDLRNALHFEIDRHTPFRPDNVYFDYRIVARRPQQKRMTVELTTVPREVVDALLSQVQDWGVRPSIVDIAANDAPDGIGINLLKGSGEEHSKSGLSRLAVGYVVTLFALLAGVIYVPLHQLSATDQLLLKQLAEEKDKAQQIMAMRAEAEQAVRAARFLDERKKSVPGVLHTINDLTRTLPDHTWLTSLTRHNNQMTISGKSAAAAELIALLGDISLFQNPAFSSPIMQEPQGKLENFEMSFELVQGNEP